MKGPVLESLFNKVAGRNTCETPPVAASEHDVIQQNNDVNEYLFFSNRIAKVRGE